MAAAAVPRSRGVAGGLYFLFTLMCLVCLTSSLMDKDKLEEMKENLQEIQQELDKAKAHRHAASQLMDLSMGLMASEDSTDEFSHNIQSFLEKTKTFVDEQNRKTDVEIEKTEQGLRKMNKLIEAIEESQAEL